MRHGRVRSLLIVFGFIGLLFLGWNLAKRVFHPGLVHLGSMQQQKAVYTCPMHPTYTSDRPGDCPICGMRLVKREEASGGHLHEGARSAGPRPEGYASIRLTPEKRQLIGVKTEPAAQRPLVKTIRTLGRIAYDPELFQAQAEYLQAFQTARRVKGEGSAASGTSEQLGRLVEAARLRLRLLGLGEDLIQELQNQEESDRRLLLADPTGAVWVYAPIYEFEIPLVKAGQTAQVELPSVSGKFLEGIVRAVDPVLDPATRSARARILLTDPDRILRPEMYVNVSLRIPLGERLAVPGEAVFDTGTRKILFVDKGEGVLEPRQVSVGATADHYAAVESGVAEGEPVVVNGNFLVDSESRLQAALQGISPAASGESGKGTEGHHHGQ